jgi:hypothetical protein
MRQRTLKVLLALCAGVALHVLASDAKTFDNKETDMNHHARGPFDVTLAPLPPYNDDADAKLGRFSLDKRFHGDLEALSKGEMLSSGSAKDSGGYVAIERVTGALGGRKGSFALQHNATMTHGVPYLNIIVVPGSGSGELAGLSGKMNIIIAEGGKHSYEFEYSFGE